MSGLQYHCHSITQNADLPLADFIVGILCAELLFVLIRASDLTTMLKRDRQRTKFERIQMSTGLIRSYFLGVRRPRWKYGTEIWKYRAHCLVQEQ